MIRNSIALLLLLTAFSVTGQDFPGLNNLIAPSPNAQSLAQYGDHPASQFSGVPNISFPIESISGRHLSTGVVLKYNASGIKVRQDASWVGLGWNLSVGGVITRVVRGRPDDDSNGFLDFASSVPDYDDTNLTESDKLDIAEGWDDYTPDMFYYNVVGYSGKFMFGNDGNVKFLPQNDIKVVESIHGTGNTDSFEFILPNGTKFKFGGTGATETTEVYQRGPDPPDYTSAWYLTEIESADGTESITFEYSTTNDVSYITNQSEIIKYYYNVGSGSASKSNGTIDSNPSETIQTITSSRRLERIVFDNGKIEFVTSSNRSDLSSGGYRLDKVVYYTKHPRTGTYEEERTTEFNYDYFQASGGSTYLYKRLKLNSIQVKVGTNSLPKTEFEYLNDILPPKDSDMIDHWGYYNSNPGSLVPKTYYNSTWIGTGDRSPDATRMLANSLRKVKLPTGGATTYILEPNTYHSGEINHLGGGLRIRTIISDDQYSNSAFTRTYLYTDPDDATISSGTLTSGYNYSKHLDVSESPSGTCIEYNVLILEAHPTGLGSQGGSVVYEYVTVINGDDSEETGKTVFKYTVDPDLGVSQEYPYTPITDNSWARGKPLEITQYKHVGSGSYRKTVKTVNTYTVSTSETSIKGLTVAYDKMDLGNQCSSVDYFIAENSYNYSKFEYLSKTENYVYDPSDDSKFSKETINYFYDNDGYHLLDKIERTLADGNTLRTEFTYVHDLTSTQIFSDMVDENILNPLVKKITYKDVGANSYVVGYTETEFVEKSTDRFYPSKSIVGKFDEPMLNFSESTDTEEIQLFDNYDSNGNLLDEKTVDGEYDAVIYGYRDEYIIASVSNALATEIAFTSFECDTYGGWTLYSGATNHIASSENKTGSYSLNQQGDISKSNLPTGDYVITFWEKGGTHTVSGTGLSGTPQLSTLTTSAENGWSLIKATFTVNNATNSITITGTVGEYIDELRLYPADAAMSTSTFDLFLGLTSVTDNNNIITTTRYDDFGRAKYTMDHDGNILQYNEYNIKN